MVGTYKRSAVVGLVFNALALTGCAVPVGPTYQQPSYQQPTYQPGYNSRAGYDCARLESAANRRDNMPTTVRGVIALRNQSLWPHERQALDRADRGISPDAPPACREVILATELDTTEFTTMAQNACPHASPRQQQATERAFMNRAAAWRTKVERACREPYRDPYHDSYRDSYRDYDSAPSYRGPSYDNGYGRY